jgi:dihydrofolate reductase
MPRRLVSFHLCSLDGAVDDPTRGFPVDAPGPPAYDERMVEQERRLIARQDCMLLGRGMYDEWSRYWPTVRDIGLHGSITLTQALLAEGLVDEMQLAVAPVLDPVGRRLSDGLPDLVRLELVETVPTPGGALWLTHRRPAG